ncbi:hypothetical protein D3C84_868720 [compost metagenome]
MHMQAGEHATPGHALIVFKQLSKVILPGGLLHTPVCQRVAPDTQQSKTIRLERAAQRFASADKVLFGLGNTGENGRSHFDLPLEHLIRETFADRRIARVNRRAGRPRGHTSSVQISDEVFLFNPEFQMSVHRRALSDNPPPLLRAQRPDRPLFANLATLPN